MYLVDVHGNVGVQLNRGSRIRELQPFHEVRLLQVGSPDHRDFQMTVEHGEAERSELQIQCSWT